MSANEDIESMLRIGKTPLQVAREDVKNKSNTVLAEVCKLQFLVSTSFNQKDSLSIVMMSEIKDAYSRLGNAIIDLGLFHENLENANKNPEGVSAVSREAEIAMKIQKSASISSSDNYHFGFNIKLTPEMIEEVKAIIARANAQAGNPDLGPAIVSLAIANAQVAANGESLGIDSKGLEEIIGESPFSDCGVSATVSINGAQADICDNNAPPPALVVENSAEGVPLTTELLKENILKDVPVAEQIDRDVKP